MDEISPGLLEVILKNLILKFREENPTAYRLAGTLLNYNSQILRTAITKFFEDIATNEDTELRDDKHELIFELNKIDPTLAAPLLPMLEKDLGVRKWMDIDKILR